MTPSLLKEVYKHRIVKSLASGDRKTVKEIANWTRMHESDDSQPRHRALIRDLIGEGYLIGSTGNGYKLMTTAKEVQVYMNSLMKRQIGVSARILSVYNAAKGKGLV